jgi:hypothetical protein
MKTKLADDPNATAPLSLRLEPQLGGGYRAIVSVVRTDAGRWTLSRVLPAQATRRDLVKALGDLVVKAAYDPIPKGPK